MGAAAIAFGTTMMPTAALAASDYVPQLKDMQQIYCKLCDALRRFGNQYLIFQMDCNH